MVCLSEDPVIAPITIASKILQAYSKLVAFTRTSHNTSHAEIDQLQLLSAKTEPDPSKYLNVTYCYLHLVKVYTTKKRVNNLNKFYLLKKKDCQKKAVFNNLIRNNS